jgi:hypothetical protein
MVSGLKKRLTVSCKVNASGVLAPGQAQATAQFDRIEQGTSSMQFALVFAIRAYRKAA